MIPAMIENAMFVPIQSRIYIASITCSERFVPKGTRVSTVNIAGETLPVRIFPTSDKITVAIKGIPRGKSFDWIVNGSDKIESIREASPKEDDRLQISISSTKEGIIVKGGVYGYHFIEGGYCLIQPPIRLVKMEEPKNLLNFVNQFQHP